MYQLQLSAPRQNPLVVHPAMAFTIVASGSTCKASTTLVEAALSQCRATHRQKSSWPHRQITAPRALGLDRLPAPPLSSQHSSELHRVSALHSLNTLITPHSEPQVVSKQIRKWTAASLALLPLLLRAMQPSAASAEALATDLQQASGVDGENIISSAREAVSAGGFNGMTVTDSITTVLFVLAVGALLILTLGVAYLSIGSFFDDKKQTEDLQKLEAADRSRAASTTKPGLKKPSKKRPASASRGGGKGFGGKEF